NCDKLSIKGNKKCLKLENVVYSLYNEAENDYIQGNIVIARNKLIKLYKEYYHILHPNHYIMFNVYVLLAGLLRHDPNKQVFESLRFLRKAVISAENVLPVCSLEKIHLYVHLSHYTFNCSNVYKSMNKGLGISPKLILNPIYSAIWNSYVLTGKNSTLSLILTQQLRTFAIALNIFTPYIDHSFIINRKNEFCNFYYKVTQNKTQNFNSIKKIMKQDSFYPIYMSCQCMDIDFKKNKNIINIFKSFKKNVYLGNGLTALSLAAAFGNIKLVKLLLKLNYSIFAENELHFNALLYMASSFLPNEQINYHSNYYYTLLKDLELKNFKQTIFSEQPYMDDIHTLYNFKSDNDLPLITKNSTIYVDKMKQKINNLEKCDEPIVDKPFPLDILLDDDLFIYGPKCKELDTRQKNILILFLKTLTKIQTKKKKSYKNELRIDNKFKEKDDHKTRGECKNKHEHKGKRKNMTNSTNNKSDNSSYTHSNYTHSSYTRSSYTRSSDSDTSQSSDKTNSSIYTNNTNSTSKSDIEYLCNTSDTSNSEDVFIKKVDNFYINKLLTKTFSHSLLGSNSALHYACARGKIELAKQLILSGVPVMLLNGEGSTPLHMAAFNGHNEIVKLLITYKSDVNSLTTHCETPLMLATYGLHY
ncbi:SET domain protein, putative, partial [Hepatocystis sp. ex Piliocolobus tephrosceles]